MTATSPYRARQAPVSTMSVSAVALPRALGLLFLVLFIVPLLLHLFLWSRVVTVRCERGEGQRLSCDVDEVAIARESHQRRDATRAVSAVVVGPVHRSRGDVHIELHMPGGPVPLTTGFNGDKEGQIRAAERLTQFFRRPDERSVTLSFGSRWRAAWIFLAIDSIFVLIMYPIFGQRLRVTADRGRDTLEVRRRVWPLPGTRVVVPLSRVVDTGVVEVLPRRHQLVVVTNDQHRAPLTWPLGAPSLLAPAAEALRVFLADERARYRGEA